MAKLRFLGIAQAVSQVETITLGGTWSAGETATITINGKFVQYVVESGDAAADVAAGLQALADASDEPEFQECTWTVVTTAITATGTAGIPTTITVSEGSASGTIATTTTTSATGPYHWDNAANWSTAAVPVNSDEVYIDLEEVEVRYGFPTGLTLAKFVMSAGSVGNADWNDSGYAEFRDRYLTVSSAIVTINGGTLVRVSTESANTVVNSQATGVVDIKTNHASAAIYALAGSVRVCPADSDTGQASIVRCSPGASLEIGAGFTVATMLVSGTCTIRGAVTTLTIEEDTTKLEGSATTVNLNGGIFSYETASTITTVTQTAGTFDCSADIRGKTITTFNFNGGQLLNPHRIITFGTFTPGADTLMAS